MSIPKVLSQSITLPGDKSISHRALMLGAIALGNTKIRGLSMGSDIMSTISCLRSLGVEIGFDRNNLVTIRGNGGSLQKPNLILNAGNSGTTIRILTGMLATQGFQCVITGDESLKSRPMLRIIEPLNLMGAEIHGNNNDTQAPLIIQGRRLHGIKYTMPTASAQVKSALIIAGLLAEGETLLRQPWVSRDHTEKMVSAMGGLLTEDITDLTIIPSTLNAIDVNVPGDISSAAFWIIAGICHPNARLTIQNCGVNPTRTGIIDIIRKMGGVVAETSTYHTNGEPVADLLVESSKLTGIEINGSIIPRIIDELPVIALAACFANGTTVIRDAQELRSKESDRISTTVSELSKLGACVEELPDGMVIKGPAVLSGNTCYSHGDHRLAMTLGIAALLCEETINIVGKEAASISYPEFWDKLGKLIPTGGF